MKLSKRITLGLILSMAFCLTTLLFTSCSQIEAPSVIPTKSWSEKFGENPSSRWEVGSLADSFDEQYNVNTDELTAYDFMRFRYKHRYRNLIKEGMNSQSYSLTQYNAAFPIESMLLLDQNTICAIYKLALEGGEQTIAYVVFKREFFETNEGLYEEWEKNGELYFISERLRYADYQSINVGDSMVDAIKIDPAIEFDKYYFGFSFSLDCRKVTAYRVLTDGILILEFEDDGGTSPTDPSTYTVTQKTFYPYSGTESPEGVSLTLAQIKSLIQ